MSLANEKVAHAELVGSGETSLHSHAGGSSLPAGLIVMWHGLLSAIPSGWALCDGANGTPDLRDKFVKGTSVGQDPGSTGGNLTHTHADHVQDFTGPSNIRTGGAILVFNSPTPITLVHDSPNHEPPYYELAFIMKL